MVLHDGVEDPLLTYVNITEALFLAMLVVVILAARHARGAVFRRAAVHAGLSAALGLLCVKIIGEFMYRARPFVAHPAAIHLFSAHAHDSSFPSDHATASMAIAVALLLRQRFRWGSVMFVLAAILCFGRVALGFHYPTDVIAGAVLGGLSALVLWLGPVRGAVDAVSDWFGGLWDRATDAVLARAGRRPRELRSDA